MHDRPPLYGAIAMALGQWQGKHQQLAIKLRHADPA
jgi:hypothetical protein